MTSFFFLVLEHYSLLNNFNEAEAFFFKQVVYILDQVRALEEEILHKIELQGLVLFCLLRFVSLYYLYHANIVVVG